MIRRALPITSTARCAYDEIRGRLEDGENRVAANRVVAVTYSQALPSAVPREAKTKDAVGTDRVARRVDAFPDAIVKRPRVCWIVSSRYEKMHSSVSVLSVLDL